MWNHDPVNGSLVVGSRPALPITVPVPAKVPLPILAFNKPKVPPPKFSPTTELSPGARSPASQQAHVASKNEVVNISLDSGLEERGSGRRGVWVTIKERDSKSDREIFHECVNERDWHSDMVSHQRYWSNYWNSQRDRMRKMTVPEDDKETVEVTRVVTHNMTPDKNASHSAELCRR